MASPDAYLASIEIWSGNFAPKNWMFCQGQKLQITQYTALFSLLGNTYGGDGRTYFNLPDLRGRVPLGVGSAPDLDPAVLGEKQLQQNANGTDNKRASIVLNYIICVNGLYPPRE